MIKRSLRSSSADQGAMLSDLEECDGEELKACRMTWMDAVGS